MAIKFTVPGIPVSKARARTVKVHDKTMSFTPAKTRNYEAWVRICAMEAKPESLIDGPIVLELTFYLQRPKSRPKRDLYPDRKPDLDNLIKSIKDACNGLIWTDDARVVEIRARKRYGEPRVEVEVREIDEARSCI